MRAILTISCATLLGLMASGCATQQTARNDAAHALSGPSSQTASLEASNSGIGSAAEGDHWTAANLFEQAVAGYDSPGNRFNLATEYQNTGRLEQAVALYRTVVVDGQFTKAITHTQRDERGSASFGVNLADESQRRIAAIQSGLAPVSASSASDFGHAASASAFVGGPSKGLVSDARALSLDEAADDATGE